MQKKSAGILLYRCQGNTLQVFLVHPGGPYFNKKDAGAWSIPKGEIAGEEDALTAAKREFYEETGFELMGHFMAIPQVTLKSGKVVVAWAIEGNVDPDNLRSNSFSIEWPPRSGKFADFPEIDKGEWFSVEMAKVKINPAQVLFIDNLVAANPCEQAHQMKFALND